MARCKECLYYKICKSYADDVSGSNRNDDELFYDCSDFKNKADFQEVKHGEWIYNLTYYESDECNCSLCGQLMTTAKGVRMNYCPNCGAKMDGDVK